MSTAVGPDVEQLSPVERQVMEELNQIHDPCSVRNQTPLTLTEMGIVDELSVSEDGLVHIGLLLTDPSCVFFFDMGKAIEDRVGRLPGVTGVSVRNLANRWWEPERMTPEVHARIAEMRAQRKAKWDVSRS